MRQLERNKLSNKCDPGLFEFETTDNISTHKTFIGQDRLVSSVDFGINMQKDGYNIFALGPNKTDKLNHIRHFLKEQAKDKSTPPDICYVNNFDDTYKPKALTLPPGRGCELKDEMDELLEDLIPTLNSAFETEEYQNRRQSIKDELQQEQEQTLDDLKEKAREKGLALIQTPSGFSFAPSKDGDLLDEEDVKNLSKEEREEIERKTKELQKELQKIIERMPSDKRKVRKKLKELDREIAGNALIKLFENIQQKFSDLEEVQEFLDEVKADILDNVQAILKSQNPSQQGMAQMMQGGGQQGGRQMSQQQGGGTSVDDNSLLQRYQVNVLVDHRDTEGAPVIYENNPTYKNLIGRVEYQSQMGALKTDFSMIKPGALHKANGGYLMIDVRRVLLEPFAWEGLKRMLKSGKLTIESMGESYRLISTVSLEPSAVDLDIKVVLLGERLVYYLLCEMDPDFQTLFKVEADFADEVDRNDDNQQLYAQLLAGIIEKHELHPFDKKAVARVIEHSSRLVSDSHKLSAKTEEINDLLLQADYWCDQNNHEVVQKEDVQKAIDQQMYRSGRIRDKVQESIDRDFIFIDTKGEETGQINGLAVTQIGNLTFGRPNRITARVQLGKGEIIDIEREVKMSGSIHAKGVLILKGFLGERYAENRPLSLTASLVFEQSYSNIDGDSASSAELYALLSAIGDIPLKQSLSVTGSVNQHGIIQPIGGVNEKIEGFFDICKERGLTGDQGVLIPQANEKNLMLKDEVIYAAEADEFHIYSVASIDEGMELLTGLDMGEKDETGHYPKGTVNFQIMQVLDQMAKTRKTFITDHNGSDAS